MKLQRIKSNMTQWINLLQNNRSVLRMVVTFIVPRIGPMHLVLVGLWQASRQAGRQAGRQA